MEDYETHDYRLKKNKRESSQSFILMVVSMAVWIYFYSTKEITAYLFYKDFISSFNAFLIGFNCLILVTFLISRRKIRFYTFYKILSYFLGFVTLLVVILFIVIISTQNDPFSGYYENTYILFILMFFTVTNSWIVSLCEFRIIIILIEFAIAANEMLRNLLEQYTIIQNNAQDEENAQQQQERVNRIQSIDTHQLNLIYGNQCTICDEECNLQEKSVQLKCLHIFHGECIRKWLLQQRFCPNCRDQVY